MRRTPSGTFSWTFRYQSPESKLRLSSNVPTSRAYDMWSMGCILLEFIIWLLYGWDELFRFNNSFTESFFITDQYGSAMLQDRVEEWIGHIRQNSLTQSLDGCTSRALRDLLDFVHNRLLIEEPRSETDVPTNNSEGPVIRIETADQAETAGASVDMPRRAKSWELFTELERIWKNEDPTYFYNDTAGSRYMPRGPRPRNSPPSQSPSNRNGQFLSAPHPGQMISPESRSSLRVQRTLVIANTQNQVSLSWRANTRSRCTNSKLFC